MEKKLWVRKKDKAEEMYKILKALVRAKGDIDSVQHCIEDAAQLIRRIDNPIIDKSYGKP